MDTFRDPLVPRGTTSAASARDTGGAAARRRMRKPLVLTGMAAALLVGLPAVLVGGASGAGALTSNLPVFPNNLNVFPNRDFVSIDGYSEHGGDAAKIEVTRPGVGVVGSAIGIVSGGDLAFEVNHPGGYCWGAGTGLAVTPDIQAGDIVSIKIAASATAPAVDEATEVQDVYASDAVQNGTTVTVSGHIGPNVNPDNLEQRIIEPLLVPTAVGKRDVRATPGPLTPANKGGYSSSLTIDQGAHTFLATYIFDNLSDATIAANAGLGERAMAWEFTDPAANRQGMTIAEFGEVGGPGMGGCPNGPLQSGPPGPTNVVAALVSGGATVHWTPAVGFPGTPAILGYEVLAVAQTPGGEQAEIGKRISNPAATGTTISGLQSGVQYKIEVASYSTVGKTFPVVDASVDADIVPPVVSSSPNGGTYPVPQQVTLTSNELGSDIWFTTDGSAPIVAGSTTATAQHFTGPITISGSVTLKFAAFDPSGNVSPTVTQSFAITNDPVPAATSFTTSSVGLNQVTLNWNAADPGLAGHSITDYQVDVFNSAAATTLVKTVNTGSATTATITGLPADTPLWFTVKAKNDVNSAYGPASAVLGPLSAQGALVANAGFDQTGVARGTTVNLTGLGSTSGAAFTWTQVGNTAADAVQFTSPTNARDTSFTLPFFVNGMSNTLTFDLKATLGGSTIHDQVVITAKSDVVSITTAKWKPGDFRVVGVSSPGSTVTIRTNVGGTVYGTALTDATGAFDFRLRNGQPAALPAAIAADSNMGGTSAPFNVATK